MFFGGVTQAIPLYVLLPHVLAWYPGEDIQLSAGRMNQLVIRNSKPVCWGYWDCNQIDSSAEFRSLVLGETHACGLIKDSGALKCYQLASAAWALWNMGGGRIEQIPEHFCTITKIAMGTAMVAVLCDDGSMKVWKGSSNHLIGGIHTTASNVDDLMCGRFFCCTRNADTKVPMCSGYYGSDKNQQWYADNIGPIDSFLQTSTASSSACAIVSSDKTIKCFVHPDANRGAAPWPEDFGLVHNGIACHGYGDGQTTWGCALMAETMTVKCYRVAGENTCGKCSPPEDLGAVTQLQCGENGVVALEEGSNRIVMWGCLYGTAPSTLTLPPTSTTMTLTATTLTATTSTATATSITNTTTSITATSITATTVTTTIPPPHCFSTRTACPLPARSLNGTWEIVGSEGVAGCMVISGLRAAAKAESPTAASLMPGSGNADGGKWCGV